MTLYIETRFSTLDYDDTRANLHHTCNSYIIKTALYIFSKLKISSIIIIISQPYRSQTSHSPRARVKNLLGIRKKPASRGYRKVVAASLIITISHIILHTRGYRSSGTYLRCILCKSNVRVPLYRQQQ